MNKWQERNNPIIEQFRANGGKIKGGGELILLTTTGAKTGQPRVIPLMNVPDGDRFLAVASKGGSPKHPEWYNNLIAHPEVTVEAGTEKFAARARLLSGEERTQAFAVAARVFKYYAEYQEKTEREIPIFALERLTK